MWTKNNLALRQEDGTKIFIEALKILCKRLLKFEGHPLWVRHKKDWDCRFIPLLLQAAILSGSDAGRDGVEPALGFIIQNCQSLCERLIERKTNISLLNYEEQFDIPD